MKHSKNGLSPRNKPEGPFDPPEEIRRIFDARRESRRARARLPIEEKIRILVELQKIAVKARIDAAGKNPREPWRI